MREKIAMTVRITQLDGKLPNLALMRIAAWHRAMGDEIHFRRSPYRRLDDPRYSAVYGSSIFSFSAGQVERLAMEYPGAIIGGTGSGSLSSVEHLPGFFDSGLDYSMYPDFSASIGFTQRGCRLSCKFCVVPKKEGKPLSASSVHQIWRGEGRPKHLHLLDNDFFGGPEWQERVAEIKHGDFKVSFTQGINVRAVTDDVAAAIASIKYRDDSFSRSRLYTAWDNLKDEQRFFDGVGTLERNGVPPRNLMVYMLVGFDKNETWERIFHRFRKMTERGISPYPMVYNNENRDLKRFQRWAVTGIWRSVPWPEYSTRRNRPVTDAPLFDGRAEQQARRGE
jgi:hypothetical protein